MEFASSVSRHPVASQAVGEVAGAVLEAVGDRPDLVMVTVTRPHAGALEDIVATVEAALHPLATLGAGAESVVGRGIEVEETPAISLWAGRVGPLLPVELTAVRLADDTWHFGGWPESVDFDPSAVVAVADPFTFPMPEFLGWLAERRPGLPVIGGYASGARGPGGSRLVLGSRVLDAGAAMVLLGSGVEVEPVLSQGCQPYGRLLTVTRSDRNIVYEVAGKPAMECLVDQITEGLRPADVAGIEGNGLYIGRLVDEHVTQPGPGDFLVRSVVGVDRSTGAVAVEDRVPLGSTIQFHIRDAETAAHDLTALLRTREADAGLLFLCNGRGTRLFDVNDHDARAVERALGPVPVGGLFAAGEFGPVGGTNFVHSFSVAMALFRER